MSFGIRGVRIRRICYPGLHLRESLDDGELREAWSAEQVVQVRSRLWATATSTSCALIMWSHPRWTRNAFNGPLMISSRTAPHFLDGILTMPQRSSVS